MASLLPPLFLPDTPLTAQSVFIVRAAYSLHPWAIASCQYQTQLYHPDLYHQLGVTFPAHLQRSSVKRQAEYLASRWLVAKLVAQFGISNWQLGNRTDRSPIWPTGLSGSLSHHAQQVMVLLAVDSMLVGNDIEQSLTHHQAEEIASLTMAPSEAALLEHAGLPFNLAVTLLFSIKETLYKALYPRLQLPLEFSDAELISIDSQLCCTKLRLVGKYASGENANRLWQVSYWQTSTQVMTWMTMSWYQQLPGLAES